MNSSTYPKTVLNFGRGPISANLRPFNFAASMLHVFLNDDIKPAILHDYIDDIYEIVRLAEQGKDFSWWQEIMENICLIMQLLHSLVARGSEHEERAKLTLEYFLKKEFHLHKLFFKFLPTTNRCMRRWLNIQKFSINCLIKGLCATNFPSLHICFRTRRIFRHRTTR